ncbi:hypothetical protein QCA50_001952 [Cerrena zonata]|uniref:RNase III domain-containing protein n=1 Tax=Cerrena zonata TaxID=2478898 RepID=A0AAW0GYA1_9APHY
MGFLRVLNLDGQTPDAASANDRLEFLGDSIIHASLGRLIHTYAPRGTPDLYSKCCGALWSNMTFCKIAEASDIYSSLPADVSYELKKHTFGTYGPLKKDRFEVKRTADLFEAIIGAYYQEKGFEHLDSWVEYTFSPLLYVAVEAYHDLVRARRLHSSLPYRPSNEVTKRKSVYAPSIRARSPTPMRKTAHPTLDTANVARWLHEVEISKSVKAKQISRKPPQIVRPLQPRRAKLAARAAIKEELKNPTTPNRPRNMPTKSPKKSSKPPALISMMATPLSSRLPTPPTSPSDPDCDKTLVDGGLFPSTSGKLIIDLTFDEDKPVVYRLHARKMRSAAPSPEPVAQTEYDVMRSNKCGHGLLAATSLVSMLSDMEISDDEPDSEQEVETTLLPTTGKAVTSRDLFPPVAFTLLSRCPSPCS